MRIDIHSHLMSVAFAEHLQGRDTLPAAVRDAGGAVLFTAADAAPRSLMKRGRKGYPPVVFRQPSMRQRASGGTARPQGKGCAVRPDRQTNAISGYVKAAGEGQALWFLNTPTIIKVGTDDSQAHLSILEHRAPPGFAPPPHVHLHSDEAFLIQEGEYTGFCGDQARRAGPGSLVFLPRQIPHGFTVSEAGPGRAIVVVSPGGFDQFVTALGKPAHDLRLPEPVPLHPSRVVQVAAAHGIQILPKPASAGKAGESAGPDVADARAGHGGSLTRGDGMPWPICTGRAVSPATRSDAELGILCAPSAGITAKVTSKIFGVRRASTGSAAGLAASQYAQTAGVRERLELACL